MNCFPCFSSQKSKKEGSSRREHVDVNIDQPPQPTVTAETENKEAPSTPAEYDNNSSIKAFNFRELASATKNFRQECLLGEGGLGKVYKGTIQATGQEVAVKQLDRNAMEGSNEFFVEVGQLSLLQHPNLVSVIGYCADGDQRLLVYEYMSGGSVQEHLHDIKPGGQALDWVTRMKIAYGAAQGLQYLHEKTKPPIIYRDLKSSKVLLDDNFNPKLSNVGLDKLGSSADSKMPMQSRMMDNHGYNAPEYTKSGTATLMTDVYSFGVILLELISGRKPIDPSMPEDQQDLVAWAQPIFKEPKHFSQMADPLLEKRFPERGLNQAVAIAAMCVQEEAAARPLISDLASVLSFLSIATEENNIPATLPASISSKLNCISTKLNFLDGADAAGKTKAADSNVTPSIAEEGSEDEDDGGSSARSSSADRGLTQQKSRNGDRTLSQKSSGRSLFSIDNDSRKSHSLNRKKSNKTSSDEEYESDDGKSAASSSQQSGSGVSEGSSGDESGQKGSSLGHKSSKKLTSMSRKSSKMKESGSSRHRSSSSKKASMKRNRQKSRKHSDDEGDDSPEGSQED
ncbi:hypothetical protein ERO13_A11G303900v2 [Gossypium hirsutum]|uniref:Serine/threonine-protein kinase CDL1-like n=1 Tax=Gossypium hirsutum TaxID=3635 RepID=A0A1U8N6K2_GOSHI|nr:probable serine/threonine-protein kinase PBL7 [Gossypium hirsutum]XP_016733435.1 probable serine/threonine-protein kinase PBL7 [Gossypium hirsutum]KAG4177403.1 hypothetical protein ERO13_A11G303900v2 [Gossypium hirsutum]